jgi:hypothetical protein
MHAVVGARRIRARAVARTGAGSSGTLAWQLGFFLQNLRQNLNPVTKLGRGLDLAFVLEFGPVPADEVAHHNPIVVSLTDRYLIDADRLGARRTGQPEGLAGVNCGF